MIMKKDIQANQKNQEEKTLLQTNTERFFKELKKNKSDNDAFIRLANK